MQYRRSRTDMPRASPFNVRSSMKITLLTVVYAGLQTALNHRGRVRYPLVCPNPAQPRVFPNGYHAKKTTASSPFLTIPRPFTLLLGTTNYPLSATVRPFFS